MSISSKVAGLCLGLAVASPAFAQNIPVVKALPGLCPVAYEQIETWATTFARNAALAAPTLKAGGPISCDDPAIHVRGGHTVNASTLRAAKKNALAVCNANRADGTGPCAIIAYMEN